MKNSFYLKIFIVFIFILFFVIYNQHKIINFLRNENELLDNKLSKLNDNFDELTINYQNLDEEYNTLFSENNTLNKNYEIKIKENKLQKEEINNLTINYNEVVEDYKTLFEEIGQFKKSIENSMEWFKSNATIDNLKDSRRIKNLLKKCVDCKEEICYIKTACINLINDKELNLKYELDAITVGVEDKLLSLDKFLEKRKGDCEDFSLFYVAELRFLIDYVISKEKTPVIETIIKSDTKRSYDIVDRWYYPEGIEKKLLSKEYIYPYVSCGTLFDPNTQEIGGHCVVMFSKKVINSNEDLENITNIQLIEPQNGIYLGDAYNNIIFKTNDEEVRINNIITHNDYFMHGSLFIKREPMWYSYGYYYNKINDLEK